MKHLAKWLCLLIGLLFLPAAALAQDTSGVQIRTEGGSAAQDGVQLSKTIRGTGSENLFDITLEVQTQQSMDKLLQDAAVVIVMDFSATMNQRPGGDESLPSRLDSAKEAASAFIRTFCDPEKELGSDRELGFVTFCQEAAVLFPLEKPTEAKRNAWLGAINDPAFVAPPSQNGGKGWTNVEAGLVLARNLLARSSAAHRFIILISDGFPTTYISPDADAASISLIEGLRPTSGFWDYAKVLSNGTRGVECTSGTSYSETAAIRAREAADAIKASGIDIFSIGVHIGDETIQHHIDRITWDSSVVERPAQAAQPGYVYEIGAADDPDSYRDWLGTGIGGGPHFGAGSALAGKHGAYVDANDTTAMTAAFEKILQEMETINQNAIRDTWIASDPMGSGVEFLQFLSAGENDAAFSQNTILWDLKTAPCRTRTEGGTTWYTYSLSYRVRLKNERAGFLPATRADVEDEPLYLTNGSASLHYKLEQNGHLSPDRWMNFPMPAVEGYHGLLSFTKLTTETGGPHAGVSFQLSHEADCALCGGRVVVSPLTGTSDENGRVNISGIPSGHSYRLVETGLNGYVERSYRAVVSYGTTVLYDESGQAVTSITNELIPCTLILSAQKRMDGQPPQQGAFSFELVDHQGRVLEMQTAAADGEIVFSPLHYSVPGQYVYRIREVRGNDPTVEYDAAVYTIAVEVSKTDAGCSAAIASVLKDGRVYTGEIRFENRTRPPSLPQTGDAGQPLLWMALLVFSGTLGGVLMRKRN